MRSREKLTPEEKVALALELIKRERSLEEIRRHYRVSHTTAYKVRNAFLEGGRAALLRDARPRSQRSLEARVRAIEEALRAYLLRGPARPPQRAGSGRNGGRRLQGERVKRVK